MIKRLWSYRREAASVALHWSGIARLFEAVAQPRGAIILMYHSIAPNDVAEYVDPQNQLSPEKF